MRPLTDVEKMVLQSAAMGRSEKETAKHLGLSGSSVTKHRQFLMLKLGATNMTHAVAIGMVNGLLVPGGELVLAS